MVSPLTHTEGLRHSVTSVVQEKDVDDDNGNELARTFWIDGGIAWIYGTIIPG